MKLKIKATAAVGALALSALAASGSGTASAADAATTSPVAVHSQDVTIVGNAAPGMRLSSEHRNRDGSVTSKWADSHGDGFTYAGTPGVTVHLLPAKVGKHTAYGAAVTMPKIAKTEKAINAAVETYRRSGQSVYTDAMNAGIPGVASNKQFAKFKPQTGVSPRNVSSGSYYQGGCIYPSTHYYTAGLWGCVQRNKLQTNGGDWWLADDMMATENPLWAWPSYLIIEMWYGAGNNVVNYTPSPGQTGCHSETVGATLGYTNNGVGAGVNYSETNNVCSGDTGVLSSPGRLGIDWHGTDSHQETIEEIDVVHSPPNASIANSDLELVWGPNAEYYRNCAPPFTGCS